LIEGSVGFCLPNGEGYESIKSCAFDQYLVLNCDGSACDTCGSTNTDYSFFEVCTTLPSGSPPTSVIFSCSGYLPSEALDPTPSAEPVAVAEPVSEPVAEPVSEPVAEPVSEPAAEPVSEPVAEPVSEPVAEPVSEPVAEPVSEPAAEPTSEPLSDGPTDAPDAPAAAPSTDAPLVEGPSLVPVSATPRKKVSGAVFNVVSGATFMVCALLLI
jgi:hypothetical protein